MGFCRRCGDIVAGSRCKCGGAAVAPSVQFNKDTVSDRWSRTYVTKDSSPTRKDPVKAYSDSSIPIRKFPRPDSVVLSKVSLNDRVSAHIQSVSINRPPSPLKKSATLDDISSSADDILYSPDLSTLSKAYGSVLQPKETLTKFSCVLCSAYFPPDATIFPDPNDPFTTTRFLCKKCFIANGGSKGDCASCKKPVLIVKNEGSFIENGGKIWHKNCFHCDACFKYIGEQPLVDLMGRPSCEECFNSCLKRNARDSPSARRSAVTPERSEIRYGNPGGYSTETPSRKNSPALELHQRFTTKSREGSPALQIDHAKQSSDRNNSPIIEELTERLLAMKAGSPSTSPTRRIASNLQNDSRWLELNATHAQSFTVEEQNVADEDSTTFFAPRRPSATSQTLYSRKSTFNSPLKSNLIESQPTDSIDTSTSMPELMSDFSDTATQSSGIVTPPLCNFSPGQDEISKELNLTTPTSKSRKSLDSITFSSPQTPCAKCSKPLLRGNNVCRFVTVPEDYDVPKSYHVDCFRCVACGNIFEEVRDGQAPFVRCSKGYCHIGCATPEKITLRANPRINTSINDSSRPIEKQPLTAPPSTSLFPRFGSTSICPGCHKSVSPMEKGVIPGPQGSKWHSSCLICGGKGYKRKNSNEPGCGKRLDSAAKTDGEGGVWCRECLLKLPVTLLPPRQESPTRDMLTPLHTGSIFNRYPVPNKLTPQFTGTTTIARQFTGLGSASLTTQLTGGGLSPTRQLMNRTPSPTKQIGRKFPRPKSMMGVRSNYSIDEGRGRPSFV